MRGNKSGLSFVLAVGLLGGSVTGVAAQDAEPPTESTGRLSFGPQVGTGTQERVGGKDEIRGTVFGTPVAAMSDPRLDGAWTRTNNLDQYDEPPVWTWQALWRVVTDDGAVIEFDQGGSAWALRGVIIDGEMPPPPEAASQ